MQLAAPQLVLFSLLLSLVACSTSGQSSGPVSGVTWLCLEGSPDGLALVPSSQGKEYLVLFKSNAYWILDLQQVLNFILGPTVSLPLITFNNQRPLEGTFSHLLASPNSVVSFTGLKSRDMMHSTLLAFKDNDLFHYKVLLAGEGTALKAELLGSYNTGYWHNFKPWPQVYSVSIPRGSKIVHILWKSKYFFSYSHFYEVNEENLDNPVQTLAWMYKFPKTTESDTAFRYYYELQSGDGLSFRTGGRICINERCRFLRDTIGCDTGLSIYLNSFFFWLANRTNLTYRLVMILLTSISAINFILALSFTFNQIKRIVDLT